MLAIREKSNYDSVLISRLDLLEVKMVALHSLLVGCFSKTLQRRCLHHRFTEGHNGVSNLSASTDFR